MASTNECRALEFALATSQTGALTGSDQYNDGFPGCLVFININTATTAAMTVNIEGKSPVGTSEYYTILSSASLTATGLTVLEVYPGIGETANVSVSTVLPPTWRITVTGTSGTLDYDIAYAYIP
jgi:hypothetical protein